MASGEVTKRDKILNWLYNHRSIAIASICFSIMAAFIGLWANIKTINDTGESKSFDTSFTRKQSLDFMANPHVRRPSKSNFPKKDFKVKDVLNSQIKLVITGTVTDEFTNQSLENVTVFANHKSERSTTDENGIFNITLIFSKASSEIPVTLTYRKLGYETGQSTETLSLNNSIDDSVFYHSTSANLHKINQ